MMVATATATKNATLQWVENLSSKQRGEFTSLWDTVRDLKDVRAKADAENLQDEFVKVWLSIRKLEHDQTATDADNQQQRDINASAICGLQAEVRMLNSEMFAKQKHLSTAHAHLQELTGNSHHLRDCTA